MTFDDLVAAIEAQVSRNDLDARTRLLIEQAVAALERCWGIQRLQHWLEHSPVRKRLASIRSEIHDDFGFPSLRNRVMEITRAETVLQYLRELGIHAHKSVTLAVGWSVALILAGALTRRTENIDVVSEVPAELRNQHDLLRRLGERYHLQLTHFQSHYLPEGWEQRLVSFGRFGALQVLLVDPIVIFLCKLFSSREEDRDDLRHLSSQLNKRTIENRFKSSTASLQAEESLRLAANANWYIV